MTDDQLKNFNRELAALVNKYSIRGFVGIIYDGDAARMRSGVLRLYDPADGQMGLITGLVMDEITEMNNKAMGSKEVRQYRELTGGPKGENN